MANAESSVLDKAFVDYADIGMCLHESELRVHDRAKLGIIVIGLDHVVRFANAEALRILGATEYLGRTFDEAIANKESYKSLIAELEARQRGVIGSYEIEIKRQSDLKTVPVSITGIPLRDRDNEIIGSLGVLKSLEIEEAVSAVEGLNSNTEQTSGLIVKVSEYLCRTFPADAVLVTRYSRRYGHANPFLLYRFEHRTPVEPNASAEPNVLVERQKRWIPLNPEQQNWVDSSSVVAIDDIADYMEKGIWKNKCNDAMIERLLADGYTCSLTRPIRRRGRVVGMISLLRKGGRKFDKSAEEIISVLPLDAAVVHEIDAVDRDQHERRFKLLQELSRCSSARSAAKILATRLVQIFAWSHVSIFRVDYVNKQIRMVAQHWSDEDGAMLPEGYHQGLHDGVLGRVVDTKQAQFVPDVNKDRDYLFNFRSDVGAPLKSEACCPIIWGDRRVRWIINIEDSDENAFSEEEISWLKNVASEVGGMMESLGAIEFYSECFRNTSEATIVADVEFDIKKANPAAARLLGYASARDIQGSMKSLLQDERDFARLQQLPNQEAAEFFLRYGSRDAPQSALFLDSLNAIADTALASDCQNQASAEKDKTRWISVSIARTELPPDLGGSIFVLTDTRVIRDTVKREVLAKATYDVAVETRTPLALAMTALSRVSDSAPREIADTIGKALSYLARVDLGFKKLALFNESVAISPHKGRVDLQAELDALVAGLPPSLQPSISISPAPGPVVVLADHFQVALLFEIVLTLLVRRVAEESPFDVSVVAGHDAAVVCFRAFVRADTHRDRRMADIRGELAVCEPLIRRLAANNEATVTAEVADAEHFELRVAFAQTAPGGQP